MNKIFVMIALIIGICSFGWFHTEIDAKNMTSNTVIPNETVHFGNLQATNKNLFVEAKRPNDYWFNPETTSHEDVRTWEIKENNHATVKHWSEPIDTSPKNLHKVYTPSFWGELIPIKKTQGTGENPTWELTGAFVMDDAWEIELAPLNNLSNVRNEFGVGERFRVYAVIKSDDPRYRGELAIKSVAITRKERARTYATIRQLDGESGDYLYQISLASCSPSQEEENMIRQWDFDVEVVVEISGQEQVKNTTLSVYSPKLISDESEAHDFRAEIEGLDRYGIGFWLKSRSLKPQIASYVGLWFQEGVCEGETTGICNRISNRKHNR